MVKGILINVDKALFQVVDVKTYTNIAKKIHCKYSPNDDENELDCDVRIIGKNKYNIFSVKYGATKEKVYLTYVTNEFYDCLVGNLFIVGYSEKTNNRSLTDDEIKEITSHLTIIDGIPMIIR